MPKFSLDKCYVTNDFKIALGLDYGRRRMGAAIGQKLIGSARPMPIIPVKGGEPDWCALDKIVAQWRPEAIVLGKPTNLDGSIHELNDEIETLAKRFKKRYETAVFFVDEHLSSRMAIEKKKAGAKSPLDSIAAGLILETWFEEQDDTYDQQND